MEQKNGNQQWQCGPIPPTAIPTAPFTHKHEYSAWPRVHAFAFRKREKDTAWHLCIRDWTCLILLFFNIICRLRGGGGAVSSLNLASFFLMYMGGLQYSPLNPRFYTCDRYTPRGTHYVSMGYLHYLNTVLFKCSMGIIIALMVL